MTPFPCWFVWIISAISRLISVFHLTFYIVTTAPPAASPSQITFITIVEDNYFVSSLYRECRMHTFSHQRCNLEYRCYLFWSLLGPILLLLIASSLPAVITVGGHFLKCIFDCNASKVFLFQSTALKRLKECQLEVQFEAAQPSFSSVWPHHNTEEIQHFNFLDQNSGCKQNMRRNTQKVASALCWRNVPRNYILKIVNSNFCR